MSKAQSWRTLAEMIANRWCLNPDLVIKVVMEIGQNPYDGLTKAMELGVDKFTELCLEKAEI